MLNPPSRRAQEHSCPWTRQALRLVGTFLAIAVLLAATTPPRAFANTRDHLPRHAINTRLQPTSRRARPARRVTHAGPVVSRGLRATRRRGAAATVAMAKDDRRSHRGSRLSAPARHEVAAERHTQTRPVRRMRGESRAAYRRRRARAEREERQHESRQTMQLRERASARESEAPPALISPEQVAKGAQVSAAPSAMPIVANTVAVDPHLPVREVAQEAVQPKVLPLYQNGRLIVPPPLRGSREILVHQNQMADAAGLQRIQDEGQLDQLRTSRQLVLMASSESLHVNPDLPENRRCARPWTAHFAEDIARAYYARFGQPLELNSAVRTISYQLRLQRVNGNAAAINGETASPHLTGQAIDFGKRGMSMAEIAWMRAYLLPLMQSGLIDVEEEFQQSCFHISVYRTYGVPATGVNLAQTGSHGR